MGWNHQLVDTFAGEISSAHLKKTHPNVGSKFRCKNEGVNKLRVSKSCFFYAVFSWGELKRKKSGCLGWWKNIRSDLIWYLGGGFNLFVSFSTPTYFPIWLEYLILYLTFWWPIKNIKMNLWNNYPSKSMFLSFMARGPSTTDIIFSHKI